MEQRLIDANELHKQLEALYYVYSEKEEYGKVSGIEECLQILKSAPTVETTDDVLTRIGRHPTVFFGNDEWNAYVMQNLNQVCNGKTPLEAVTRLEASLN